MKVHTKIKFKKVILIAGASGLIGLFFGLQETMYFIMSEETLFYKPAASIFFRTISGLIAGSIFSYIEIFHLREYFRKKSFGLAILAELSLFIVMFLLLTLIISFIYQIVDSEHTIFDPAAISGVIKYFTGLGVYINFINWIIAFTLILFVLQVSDKFGHGILSKFIMGRYHQPKEEKRIFLFLDLNSSTQIGENLGHLEYHSLLNEFFSDVTQPIINSGGEIYQYVGDEISVSWEIKNNLPYTQALDCFVDITDTIRKSSGKYLSKYNFVPKFKAGVHCGRVTVGEVGIIKKEIVFTGDVLNTTFRIMNECPKYEQILLVSDEYASKVFSSSYNLQFIDKVKLRGKTNEMSLYAVQF